MTLKIKKKKSAMLHVSVSSLTTIQICGCQLENLSYSEIITQLKNYHLLFVFAEAKLQWIMTGSKDQMSQGVSISASRTYNLLITLLKTKQEQSTNNNTWAPKDTGSQLSISEVW